MAEERAQLSRRTGRGFMSADAANTDAEDPLQWDEHLPKEDRRRTTANRGLCSHRCVMSIMHHS